MRKYTLIGLLIAFSTATYAQAKSFTFVFLNNKPDKEVLSKEKSDSVMQGHMNNIGQLAKEGKLQAAGPFEGGGGLFIFNTTSIEKAKEWLSTDPGVKANRWNLEVFPFTPRVGSACAVAENNDPGGKKYDMVFYQFVRFTPEPNAKQEVIKQHTEYLQKLAKDNLVIAEGVFGEKQGGILVLKADVTKEIVEADPAIKAGSLKFEMKKLYIAKGSFCEK